MVHGLEDRPTWQTVCKNKYGVDYPTGKYINDNHAFTDFILGKNKKKKRANSDLSIDHSQVSELSIDEDEVISPNIKFENKFRDNRKRKFKREKSEQQVDEEVVAKLDDSIVGAVDPLTLDLAAITTPIKRHPPTGINTKIENLNDE